MTPQQPESANKLKPARGGWKSLVLIAFVVIGVSQLASWWRDERAASLIQRHARPVDITLYTTSTCPYCAKARTWLAKHDIPWRECNVETDAACMKTYESRGAPGVPLIQAKGRWHLGFDPVWLGEALQVQAGAGAQSRLSLDNSPRP